MLSSTTISNDEKLNSADMTLRLDVHVLESTRNPNQRDALGVNRCEDNKTKGKGMDCDAVKSDSSRVGVELVVLPVGRDRTSMEVALGRQEKRRVAIT